MVTAQPGKAEVATIEGRLTTPRLDGAVFRDIKPGMPLYGQVNGVLVADVQFGSSAWGYGLRQGDVIVAVNRRSVVSVEKLEKAPRRSGCAMALNIRRGDAMLCIVIQ